MPYKPKRPCRHPGCAGFCDPGELYCPVHIKDHPKEQRERNDYGRESAAQRGYDSRWQKARLAYLAKHPLCIECQREGRITAATVVDHIRPHRGDPVLFWDKNNWQPLCRYHHDQKTARGL